MLPMAIPRLVITPEFLGKTLGKPNDKESHHKYIKAGLDLLENASAGNSIVIMKADNQDNQFPNDANR